MVKKKLNFNRDYTEDALGIVEDLFAEDPIRDFINRYSPVPFVETPKGLVPLGDSGLYATPDEPADPTDCDRYPSSIYCGENPFTLTPVAIEPSIIIDECNIGIQFEPTFGFIKLPPISIVYRRKECRDPEVKPNLPKPEIPKDLRPYKTPFVIDHPQCNRGVAGILYTDYRSYQEQYTKKITFFDGPFSVGTEGIYRTVHSVNRHIDILEINFPYKVHYLFDENNELAFFHIKIRITETETRNRQVDGIDFYNSNAETGAESVKVINRVEDHWLLDSLDRGRTNIVLDSPNSMPFYGITKLDINIFEGINYIRSHDNAQHYYFTQTEGSTTIGSFAYAGIPIVLCEEPPKVLPPPILKERKNMAACCPEHTALLLALIKKVDKLSKTVGVDEYPASLPASLISKDEGFLGNLIPNANKEVPNLTQFLAWYVERFDEIMGQWEIPIEIKDSDPSKPGDQPLGVKLPNMAEAIAEIFTLAFQTNLNSETLLNFAVRTAAETVTDKQQNFITYKLMQSMAEWAGYKQKDIKLKMPILFSLGKTRYDEILNESEIDVPCVDFDEKFGLGADLMRFREAVAILQANYKKKVDPNGDVKGQILKHLLDTFATVNKVSGEDDDKDFEKFLTDVENGFINTPGANNTTEPYGRPYNQRPKIRDLTDNQPPTNP